MHANELTPSFSRAKELINGMIKMHERLDDSSPQSFYASIPPHSRQYSGGDTEYTEGGDQYGQAPRTQTVNIST